MVETDTSILEVGGIDKAILLRELVNLVWHEQASRQLWPLREARLEIAMRGREKTAPEGQGPLYFEYMDGVRIGADLSGDQVDLTRYRQFNFPQLPGEELNRRLYDRIAQYALRDAESGLVAREWVRTSRRSGRLTETPLEGSHVAAAFFDAKEREVVRVSGTVVRDDDGQLVVRTWSDRTGRVETPVPRDSDVTVIGRAGRS